MASTFPLPKRSSVRRAMLSLWMSAENCRGHWLGAIKTALFTGGNYCVSHAISTETHCDLM